MAIEIRRLGSADAVQLFELRRRALIEEPFAFLASPKDDLASSPQEMQERLAASESVVIGAFDEGLVGMIGLSRERHVKTAHRAHIWGMFVAPEAQRRGIGRQLLGAAIDHARSIGGISSVHLVVSEKKPVARQIYEHAGFVVWGVEPDCVRWEGESVRAYHLALSLDRPPTS